ncbi:hypothetical protein DFS34DRAFT_651386 [Phlyctochytrium arcticum]|nr:hypothetical protein DFS34DRAFT_651386 [Phlyctochytrium arcticum]
MLPLVVVFLCVSVAAIKFGLLPKSKVPRVIREGERVVIFGASSGIGKCLAYQYAYRGARVLLVARRQHLLTQVRSICRSKQSRCLEAETIAADITVEADVKRVADWIVEHWNGEVDTCVINAGVISVLQFEEVCALDRQDKEKKDCPSASSVVIENIFRTNVLGPITIAKYLLAPLKATRGKFVIVSSAAGTIAAPTRSLYASSKHALNGFFNSLRIEVKKYGVDVCLCMPGSVDTDLRASSVDGGSADNSSHASPENSSKLTAEECARRIVKAGDRRWRETYMPGKYYWAHLVSFFFPEWVDRKAAQKYGIAY